MVVGIGKFEDEIFLGHLSCIVFNLCALYYALEKKSILQCSKDAKEMATTESSRVGSELRRRVDDDHYLFSFLVTFVNYCVCNLDSCS
jgi:hypothetical protein